MSAPTSPAWEAYRGLTAKQKDLIRTLVQGRIDHWRHVHGDISRERLAIFHRQRFLAFCELDLSSFGIEHEAVAADIILWLTINPSEKSKGRK